MRQRRVPGLALAIARNGTILTAKGYGLADAQNDVAMKPDTRFELASITKQFTAAGIMMLVEENKVDLDAPVASYLPDIPDAWKAITVRHLLTHTSGFVCWVRTSAAFAPARSSAVTSMSRPR